MIIIRAHAFPVKTGRHRSKMLALLMAFLVTLVPVMGCLDNPKVDVPDEKDPPYTGYHPGYQVITTNTVWNDLEGLTSGPVRVTNGSKLRLDGCDLKIPIEDMAFFNRPWFVVEEGSFLEFEDSKVEIIMDPRLEGAMRMGRSNFGSGEFPPSSVNGTLLLYRTVNLVGTVDPVLGFDVRALGGLTFVVAIQEVPGADLTIIDKVPLTGDGIGWWNHIEVPLDQYVGTAPRVAIFQMEDSLPLALMTIPVVTDGGRSPPLDDFGIGFNGGWATHGLDDIEYLLSSRYNENWLIECRGEVRLWSSVITSAPKTPRSMTKNDDEIVDDDPWSSKPKNLDFLPKGFHINVDGGSLEVIGSEVTHVPIHLNSSSLHVIDSTFIGYDCVNLASSNGSVEDSVFTYETWRTWNISTENYPNFDWALSAYNITRQIDLTLTGCVFEDFPEAIDLNNAAVDIINCEFRRNQEVAIWDHRDGTDSIWTDISTGNTFNDCEGVLYFRTHGALLDFKGPISLSRANVLNAYRHRELDIGSGRELPEIKLLSMNLNRSVIALPTFLAYADGDTYTVTNLRTELYTSWGGWASVDLDTTKSFFDDIYYWYDEWYFTVSHWGFFNVDTYEVPPLEKEWLTRLAIDLRFRKRPGNLSIMINFDGERTKNLTIWDFEWDNLAKRYIEPYVDVPPGRHILEIVLTDEQSWNNIPATFTKTVEMDIIRIAENTGPDILSQAPLRDGTVILVDPNVTFTSSGPVEFVHVNTPTTFSLNISGNSSLSIPSIGRNDWKDFRIDIQGEGHLHLGNGSMGEADINIFGGSLSMEGVEMIGLSLVGRASHVSVEDCDVLLGQIFNLIKGTNMTIRSSFIEANSRFVIVNDSDLRFIDCELSSPHNFEMEMTMVGNSSFEMIGCHVTDATIRLLHLRGDWECLVTGCAFSGDEGVIEIDEHEDMDDGERMPLPVGSIDDNTFEGTNSGIVMPYWILDGVLGENELKEGARILAKYHWESTDYRVGPDPNMIIFFIEGKGSALYYDDWPFDGHQGYVKNVLYLDVTHDITVALEPPKAQGIVSMSSVSVYYGNPWISQFIPIDPLLEVNEVEFTIWEDMWGMVTLWKKAN